MDFFMDCPPSPTVTSSSDVYIQNQVWPHQVNYFFIVSQILDFTASQLLVGLKVFVYRRLASGNVHSAGSATYQICFR